MNAFLKKFRQSDSGAITVEWVVLFAAMVFLGLYMIASTDQATTAVGSSVRAQMEKY